MIDFRYTTLDAMKPHVFNTLNKRNNQTFVFVASENTKSCRLLDMDRIEYIIRELDEHIFKYALLNVSEELMMKERELKKTPQVVVPEELLLPYE